MTTLLRPRLYPSDPSAAYRAGGVATPLQAGRRIGGRYRLEMRLGSGSFGSVWKAHDEAERLDVALKILHAELGEHDDVAERFLREAAILGRLNHPGLVRTYASGEDDGHLFLVLELVEGRPLATELAERSKLGLPFEAREVVALFCAMADALEHAHDHHVVHRDLKPRNVMFVGAGDDISLRVIDFGVARVLDDGTSRATTVGRMLGSLPYMAPEQIEALPVDRRADVFALGTLLFELATLRRAWLWDEEKVPIPMHLAREQAAHNAHVAIMARILYGPRPRASAYCAVPAGVDEVIVRALAVEAEVRFGSAREMAAALESAVSLPGRTSLRPEPERLALRLITRAEPFPAGGHDLEAPIDGSTGDYAELDVATRVSPTPFEVSEQRTTPGSAPEAFLQEPSITTPTAPSEDPGLQHALRALEPSSSAPLRPPPAPADFEGWRVWAAVGVAVAVITTLGLVITRIADRSQAAQVAPWSSPRVRSDAPAEPARAAEATSLAPRIERPPRAHREGSENGAIAAGADEKDEAPRALSPTREPGPHAQRSGAAPQDDGARTAARRPTADSPKSAMRPQEVSPGAPDRPKAVLAPHPITAAQPTRDGEQHAHDRGTTTPAAHSLTPQQGARAADAEHGAPDRPAAVPEQRARAAEAGHVAPDPPRAAPAAQSLTPEQRARAADAELAAGNRALVSGAREQARDHFQRCIQIEPRKATCHRSLGLLCLRTKEEARALRSFRKYLELQPDAADAAQIRERIAALQESVPP